MSHTKGPLHVVIDERWPFSIKTLNAAGETVFSREMPCHSSADQSVDDAINCRNFRFDERDAYAQINKTAIADEVLRAAAPELLETLIRMSEKSYGWDAEDFRRAARAAIAAATGAPK